MMKLGHSVQDSLDRTTTTPATTVPSTTVARPTMTITSTTPATLPSAVTVPHPTLPQTGNQTMRGLLRIGDIGFVVGVVLIAITGLVPRRRGSFTRRSQ